MKGRKPIPTNMKKLAGDGVRDSGGRVIEDTIHGIIGPPPIPEILTGDSRIAWDSFTGDMESTGVIAHADRAALIMLCQTWAELQAAERKIAENGAVITYPNGIPGTNPWCKIRKESRAIILRLLPEFGLTPSSRSRIKIAPKEEPDEDDFSGL